MTNDLRRKSLIAIAIYILIFIFGSFILNYIIGAIISAIYDISLTSLLEANPLLYEENTKIYQASITLISYSNLTIYLVLGASLIIYYFKDFINETKTFFNIKNIIIIFFSFILLTGFSFLFMYLNKSLKIESSENQQLLEAIFNFDNGKILMIFSAILLGPIVEELVFRKALYGITQNKVIFLVATSLIFGLLHMSYAEGSSFSEWLLVYLPYVVSGLILGLTYLKSNNIYVLIVVHLLNNLLAYLLLFL